MLPPVAWMWNASATSSTTTSRMIRHPMYTVSDVPAVLDGKAMPSYLLLREIVICCVLLKKQQNSPLNKCIFLLWKRSTPHDVQHFLKSSPRPYQRMPKI